MSQYSIGIDLGTTHCVLSYLDLQMADEAAKGDAIKQEVLLIPQLTAPGSIDERLQLPSFIYQFHESEVASGDLALPWNGAHNK
mgnify:FL=1